MSDYRQTYACRDRGNCGWKSSPHTVSYVGGKKGWDDFATLVELGLSKGEYSECPKCGGPVEKLAKKTSGK